MVLLTIVSKQRSITKSINFGAYLNLIGLLCQKEKLPVFNGDYAFLHFITFYHVLFVNVGCLQPLKKARILKNKTKPKTLKIQISALKQQKQENQVLEVLLGYVADARPVDYIRPGLSKTYGALSIISAYHSFMREAFLFLVIHRTLEMFPNLAEDRQAVRVNWHQFSTQ